jgi:PEP-CTERM motif/Lectin C-type domain
MRRFSTGLVVLVFLLSAEMVALGDYNWVAYGGHQYALTQNHGTWQECENEAIAAGGHLATIRDADENAWLTEFISGARMRDYPSYSGGNAAWIGLERIGEDATNPSSWVWQTAEPVTYWNPYQHEAGFDPSGTYMYLHGAVHPDGPGEWNDNPQHEMDIGSNLLGIIETVPEPSTFVLLGIGAISLLGYAWRQRRQTA